MEDKLFPNLLMNGEAWTERWQHVIDVVSHIKFPGYQFHVRGHYTFRLVTVHIEYDEKDVMSGVEETQKGRRWLIEDDATDMAIIQTCFKALMTSLEHRGRENFTYRNKAIMQPHYSLENIMSIAPERLIESEPIRI